MYKIVKNYGFDLGLSCVFRQWRAPETHCSKLHGYALGFKLTFEADTLDDRNWVISFGELKVVRQWLYDTFDHRMLVARDDPKRAALQQLESEFGVAQVVMVDDVGCEKFAEMTYNTITKMLGFNKGYFPGVRLVSVEVREHDGNSAIYEPNDATSVAKQALNVANVATNVAMSAASATSTISAAVNATFPQAVTATTQASTAKKLSFRYAVPTEMRIGRDTVDAYATVMATKDILPKAWTTVDPSFFSDIKTVDTKVDYTNFMYGVHSE